MFLVAFVLVAAVWDIYKWLGPEDGGSLFGANVLPRTNDRAMTHSWKVIAKLFDPENANSDRSILMVVLSAAWYSLRLAIVGFVIGVGAGLVMAIAMARFRVVERGLLPYLVVSQTVPLIALAPLVASAGNRFDLFGLDWPEWLSASVIGAFLAFFPVSIAGLKGLASAPAAAVELMDSYAASWGQTLWRLRFPAAVPQVVPALKLAASLSVVGVVVAEISTGLKGGIGRLIIEYARVATSDPVKVYTAVLGAAVLGLMMAGLVSLLDAALMRNRPKEASA